MARYEMRDTRYEIGSALILAVVLTSLLAIIGVMFLMVARVNKIATSGISENKELNSAVETVVAKISQELVLDVPGMPKGGEYYDYPDAQNAWLASLEPYDDGGTYKWRQISDVTGFLADNSYDTDDVDVDPPGARKYIQEYPVITLDASGELEELWADADGDGIADSKWIELEGINSNKGKPIYAAIRVIDNGGMINVNTAYKFDPNSATPAEIDGSRLAQVHMLDFVKGVTDDIDDLHRFRCDGSEPGLLQFNDECAIRIENPDRTSTNYLPYDIGDELELRNRFLLDVKDNIARIEAALPNTLTSKATIFGNRFAPIDTSGDFDDWKKILNPFDPNDSYDFRHLLTTHNFDRIIRPNGRKMLNINDPCVGVSTLYGTINKALRTDPNFVGDVNDATAQIAVNLIDFRDNDSNVTTFPGDTTYYGFEQPCVYISELAHRFKLNPSAVGPPFAIPDDYDMSYAIELHKPYRGDDDPNSNQWQLDIGTYGIFPINWSGTEHFHVIYFEDPCVPLTITFDANDPNLPPPSPTVIPIGTGTKVFEPGSLISLQRQVDSDWITVDSVQVPGASGWWDFSDTPRSIQRDITLHKCIRRLWASNMRDPNLGHGNSYVDPDLLLIQAHPANTDFTNIGEIGMIFRKGAYYQDISNRDERIGYGTNKTEADVRLDLADPNFQQLFKYLTVFDPTVDGIDNDGDGDGIDLDVDPNELKIPGRININTAPWYVIAQLPWMTPDIAQKIVEYRDQPMIGGFESIGELMNVDEIGYYADDSVDLAGFPDLTTPDGPSGVAKDDFEERDVIFARISNLVTVRSDVFTAYILVRIGSDGPQKRVIAILDRSNVYSGDGKVRIIALHPVPDPR